MGRSISYRYTKKDKRFIVTFDEQQSVMSSCLLKENKKKVKNILFPRKISKGRNETSFIYDKIGIVSIGEYIGMENASLKDAIELLIKVNHIIAVNKEYLGSESFLKLNSQCIFIDPEQMDVFITYIPIERNDFWDEYFDFVANDLLMLPEKNNSTDNIVKYLGNYLKSDGFTIEKLNEILIDILKNSFGKQVIPEGLCDETENTIERDELICVDDNLDRAGNKERESMIAIMLLGMFLQSIIVAISTLLYLDFFEFEYLSYSNNSTLFAAVFSILIWFLIIRKIVAINRNYKPIILTKFEIINVPEFISFNEIIHEKKYCDRFFKAILPDFNYSPLAFLEGTVDGVYERIFITKSAFVLGKNEEIVDYVINSQSVGEGYIEIFNKDGIYTLIDLGSGSEIYLNNAKIENDKEVEIKNDDVLDIADRKYVFKR